MSENKLNEIEQLVKANVGVLSTPNYNEYMAIHDKYIDCGYKVLHNQFGCLNYLNNEYYKASIFSSKIQPPNNTSTYPELYLFHPESTNHTNCIMMRIYKNSDSESTSENNQLLLAPDGLFYNYKPIDSIYSSSTNHIQYTDGLLIQWGRSYIPINESTKTISFYMPYKENDNNAYDVFITSNCTDIVSYIFHTYYKSASDFTIISHLSDGTLLGNKYFKWLAIGRWK